MFMDNQNTQLLFMELVENLKLWDIARLFISCKVGDRECIYFYHDKWFVLVLWAHHYLEENSLSLPQDPLRNYQPFSGKACRSGLDQWMLQSIYCTFRSQSKWHPRAVLLRFEDSGSRIFGRVSGLECQRCSGIASYSFKAKSLEFLSSLV